MQRAPGLPAVGGVEREDGRKRLGGSGAHRLDDDIHGVLLEHFVAIERGSGGAEKVARLLDRAEVGVHERRRAGGAW